MSSSSSRPITRSVRQNTDSDDATIQQSQQAQPGLSSGTQETDRQDENNAADPPTEEAGAAEEEEGRPELGQDGPFEVTPAQQLEELRDWLKNAQALEELRSLQELRARYEAGDVTAVLPSYSGRTPVLAQQATPSASLPRPEPPKQFTKRSRMEYNRWERDCEGYFLRSPINFQTERQKVDFGIMYVSDPLRTLWESHCLVYTTTLPGWVPTWQALKTAMLNSMGTPQERKRMAYEKLKAARQQAGKSPTDLLDYMRPLWEEMGFSATPELQMLEYTSALRHDIQIELERLPFTMKCTIPMIEEQANIVYRRKAPAREQKEQSAKTKVHGRPKDSQSSEGDQKTPKKAKKVKTGQTGSKGDKKPHSGATPQRITCYKCGEPGHKSFECTNPEKPGSDPRVAKPGKGKGQKD
jgi:hypothetical protein